MLKVHIKKIGTLAILRLQGQIVIGETAALVNAVRSQRDVKTLMLDLDLFSNCG